jgi:hypothetical protein
MATAEDFRPYPVIGRVDPAELPFRDPEVSGLDSGSSSYRLKLIIIIK